MLLPHTQGAAKQGSFLALDTTAKTVEQSLQRLPEPDRQFYILGIDLPMGPALKLDIEVRWC